LLTDYVVQSDLSSTLRYSMRIQTACILYVVRFSLSFYYANKDMYISYVRRGVFGGTLQSEKLTSNANANS